MFASAILFQFPGFGFPPRVGLTEQHSVFVVLRLKEEEEKKKKVVKRYILSPVFASEML